MIKSIEAVAFQYFCIFAGKYISCFQNKIEIMEIQDCYGLAELKKVSHIKKHTVSTLTQISHPSDYFTTNPLSQNYDVHVEINDQTLTITQNRHKFQKNIDFWSKFQEIYQTRSYLTHRKSIGLLIQIDKTYSITLYHKEASIIDKWKKYLKKLIICRNFYEDYTPLKKLGQGKTAEVYLVTRNIDRKQYAVKSFSKTQIQSSQRSLKGFQNQVCMLRTLKHKYILKIDGVYQTDNSYYIINQYIKGKTLKKFISESSYTFSIVHKIIHQIAEGLRYLGKNDIAHRDIKPDNVMIREQNSEPVIVDFGLATKCSNQSYIYNRCGTPGYIAPEIFKLEKNSKITPLVDIFSLGIIYHFLLWRDFPYNGQSYQQIILENQRANFSFNEQKYQSYPKQMISLLKKMLAKQPDQRITAAWIVKNSSFRKQDKQNYYLKHLNLPERKLNLIHTSAINSIRMEHRSHSKKKSLQNRVIK